MNQFKIRQALESLSDIYQDRKAFLESKNTSEEKKITDEERYRLLKNGKLKIKSSIREVGYYDDFYKVFDLSEFEAEEKLDRTKYKKELLRLDKEYTKIKNKLVFGAEDADVLKLLNAFTDWT